MWPGPRPTCKPSFILIHLTVWPQYTNVTDRTARTDRQDRTDRQRSDSIGRTVLQTVAENLWRLKLRNFNVSVTKILLVLGLRPPIHAGASPLDPTGGFPSPKLPNLAYPFQKRSAACGIGIVSLSVSRRCVYVCK